MFTIALGLAAMTFLLCLFSTPRTHISRFARAVWVCRISAISAGLGALLFARAPPARDLFAEVNAGALYWTMFFALVLAWALCVHYAARKALEQQAWAPEVIPCRLRKISSRRSNSNSRSSEPGCQDYSALPASSLSAGVLSALRQRPF
jgi:hypothetical protein